MFDQAIKYARRGWAVFPCKKKIPITPHGFKDASVDEAVIRQLFQGHEDANIAIATGKVSGVFVVDVDVKKGKHGDESLRDLEREHGDLPLTIEAITPSGGRHIYFRYPEGGIGCKTDFSPGIDLRGDGGYVIAPPSVIDGRGYEWEASHDPDETAIADAPEWLLDILSEKKTAVICLTAERRSARTATTRSCTWASGCARWALIFRRSMQLFRQLTIHDALRLYPRRKSQPLPRASRVMAWMRN